MLRSTSGFRPSLLASRTRVLAALLATFLAAPRAAEPCDGFGRWPGGRVPFRVNLNFPDQGHSGSPNEQVDILLCAASAWRDQSRAEFAFLFEGTSSRRGFNLSDGINNVSWIDADGGNALAVTLLSGEGDQLEAFDLVFFSMTGGVANNWSGPEEPVEGELDIGAVATHEFGHALGLLHSEIEEATMFPVAREFQLPLRTLHPVDRDCIESLYGLRTDDPPTVEILSVLPDIGAPEGGNEVILEGTNFTYDSDTLLAIDEVPVSGSDWTIESCGRIRILQMPPHAPGAVDLTVANTVGTTIRASAYRYVLPSPRLISVDPTEGPTAGGIRIMVKGERFTEEAVVYIGEQALEEQEVLGSEGITGILAASEESGVVGVRLEQGGDEAVLPRSFFYNPFVLRLGVVEAFIGEDPVLLPILVTSPDSLSEVSLSLAYDPAALSILELSTAGAAAEEAEFAEMHVDNDSGLASVSIIMHSSDSGTGVPPGENIELARLVSAVSEEAETGSRIPLELVSGTGGPTAGIFFRLSKDSSRVRPVTRDGWVSVLGLAFVRGDANGDGQIDVADVVYQLLTLFAGGPASRCPDAADTNDDGTSDVSDAVFLLRYLFLGGDPPPLPFPLPGLDPTEDTVSC